MDDDVAQIIDAVGRANLATQIVVLTPMIDRFAPEWDDHWGEDEEFGELLGQGRALLAALRNGDELDLDDVEEFVEAGTDVMMTHGGDVQNDPVGTVGSAMAMDLVLLMLCRLLDEEGVPTPVEEPIRRIEWSLSMFLPMLDEQAEDYEDYEDFDGDIIEEYRTMFVESLREGAAATG